MGPSQGVDRGYRTTGTVGAILLASALLVGLIAVPAGAAAVGGVSKAPRAAPTIASFTPTSGSVGTQITITGTGFTGATAVTFGGVDTTAMRVDSSTQITATVPPYGVTGPIVVTAPGGTATSSTDFTVIALSHSRKVSLRLPGSSAKGRVTVDDLVNACAARVPVRLQHWVNGSWRWVASLTTRISGTFVAGDVSASGEYRAVARHVTLGGTDICEKATSPVVRR